jgi:aminoglycoside phosphotransferase (APT) family kinase protein
MNELDRNMISRAQLGTLINSYPLSSGANNELVMLEFDGFNAVLKKTKQTGVRRLRNEFTVLSNNNKPIGPKVLWSHFPENIFDADYLIIEHVAGQHLYELDGRAAVQLGTVMKEIHEIPVHKFNDCLEKPSWEDYYNSRLISQFTTASNGGSEKYLNTLRIYLVKIHEFGKSISSELTEKDLSLVHSDLIPLNMIFDNKRCNIIDWELARIDYPEWDICSIKKAFIFSENSYNSFETVYNRKISEKRLKLFSLMHYCNVALWRICSFYCKGENHEIKKKFLREIEEEIEWIGKHI